MSDQRTRIKIAVAVGIAYVVNLVFLVVMANTNHVNVIRDEGIVVGIPGIFLGLWLIVWMLSQPPFNAFPKIPHPFELFKRKQTAPEFRSGKETG